MPVVGCFIFGVRPTKRSFQCGYETLPGKAAAAAVEWIPCLPITFSFRPRSGLWKLLGKSPLVDLNIGDPIFHDKSLSKPEAARKMQQEAYHIMQAMNGIHPGDPTYNIDQNIAAYRKTM